MTGLLPAAIFVGGGTGSLCRYWIGRLVGERYDGAFPAGTFAINVIGCFLLGLFATLAAEYARLEVLGGLLATGFLGGFTTFSTYALESLLLYVDDGRRLALFGFAAPIGFGLIAGAVGALLGQTLGRV
jgi:fluoride exporter